MKERPTLSLVLPVFKEEPVLPELRTRLAVFLKTVGGGREAVFVDDGSSHRSLELRAEGMRYEAFSLSHGCRAAG